MHKSIPGILTIASLFLLSCGSQQATSEEVLTDVNEMCKCYRDGKNSSVKFMECSKKNEQVRDKYRSANAMLAQYDADLKKCMDNN
jgi:hypothetical protein